MKRFTVSWRDYTKPTLSGATMEYPEQEPDGEIRAWLKLLQEYVDEDDGSMRPLCTKHRLCKKLEGHGEKT